MDKPLKFILIDDNEVDNDINSGLLSVIFQGITCLEFTSCQKGLEHIKSNPEQFTDYRVILLLDIQMPEINGFQCLEHYLHLASKFKNNCEIYILTSSIAELDIRRAKSNTLVSGILEKPLDPYLLKKNLGLSTPFT